MARYTATLKTPRPATEVFAYMAAFEHTAEWDPGVASAVRTTPGEVGLGTVFTLQFKVGPGTTKLIYRVTAFDPPHSVTLRSDNSPLLISDDVIEVRSVGTGSEIAYDATLTLKGPLRLADPLLAAGFDKAADRALAGLRRVLSR